MKQIINPWITTEGYNCFGCCPTNPIGAQMKFYEVDENDDFSDIISLWLPTQNHQSWINTLHGGIQATLLDEVCGWVVFKKLHTSGVTAKFELKYKQAVSTINGPVLLRARLKSEKHHVAIVEGELWMQKQELQPDNNADISLANIEQYYSLCTTCECTYFAFPSAKADEMGYIEATLTEQETDLKHAIELAKTSATRYRTIR